MTIFPSTPTGDNIVTREQLSDYVWGTGVYVDIDQSLNFCIRQIRSVLNDSASSPRFIDTLPKQGYRFIAPIQRETQNLAPPSLNSATHEPAQSAWNESPPSPLTAAPPVTTPPDSHPQPPIQTPEINQSPPPTPHSRFWLLASIALALVVVILIGTRSLRNRSLAPTPKITSLAVLPLDNLSGDPAQDYVADGMTDELTTMLAKNSTLRLVSRTSVMEYKGAHRPLPQIARELGVDGILEGSIARSGDKVHMTIQLIQAPTDTHLWVERYDRNANDIVSLPTEAAQTIAKRLNSVVLQPAAPRYVSPEAHDAYLRGRYLWFTASDFEKSGPYFKKATELQPDYALGWSGLAMYYAAIAIEGDMSPEDAFAPGEAAAMKAVELDDSLPDAHLALGEMILISHWDWTRADQEFSRAIELDPRNADAYHLRAKMYTALNRSEEAIEAEKKSQELEQFSEPAGMSFIYFRVRRYDDAIREGLLLLETKSEDQGVHWVLSEAYRRKGEGKEAAEHLEKMLQLSGDKASAEAIRHQFERGGYRAVVLWQLNYYKALSTKQYVSPVDLAVFSAQLGNREETLALLEESYRQHSPGLLWIQIDPAFDFLRSDERYRSIIRGIGIPPTY